MHIGSSMPVHKKFNKLLIGIHPAARNTLLLTAAAAVGTCTIGMSMMKSLMQGKPMSEEDVAAVQSWLIKGPEPTSVV